MKTGPATVTLCWYALTPRGWRYFTTIIEKVHGVLQPRHGWVMDKGKEKGDKPILVEYKSGRYMLRQHREGKRVYTPLATCHPLRAQEALNAARRAAAASGDPTGRRNVIASSVEAYVASLGARNKPEMQKIAKRILHEFIPHCRKVAMVRSITADMVHDYHKALRAKKRSDRTIYNRDTHIRSWLKWCRVDTRFLGRAPSFETALPTIYDPSQIKAIIKAADAAKDQGYMRLMIDMARMLGLRDQELMHGEWSDVDFHSRVYRVQGHQRKDYKFAVKDKEQREVPIPAELIESLKAWQEMRPKSILILGTKNNKPNGHLLRSLKRLAHNASLNCGKCDGCKSKLKECGEWTLHKFRRTYITTLLRRAVDLRTVQDYAGHSDIESTMRYLRPASAPEMQARIDAVKWDE